MTTNSTKFLVLLAVGLFLYIFFFERQRPDTPQSVMLGRRILPELKPESVTSVELVFPTNRITRVERKSQTWEMTLPVKYPAQSLAIDNFLNALTLVERKQYITPLEIQKLNGNLSSFGLDNPLVKVVLSTASGRSELLVSRAPGNTDRLYVQALGSQGVSVLDPELGRHIPVVADYWRDRGLLAQTQKSPDHLSLKAGPLNPDFERASGSGDWRVSKPTKSRANAGGVDEFLRQVKTANILGFVSDNPTAQELEAWGLQSPESEAVLGLGTNTVLSLKFGHAFTNAPDLVYTLCSVRTNVVALPVTIATQAKLLAQNYRDSRLINVQPTTVDRIEITADDHFILERLGTNGWRFVEPEKLPADTEAIEGFLVILQHLEIIEWTKDVVTDYAPYGLAKPARTYALYKTSSTASTTKTNSLLVQLDFGVASADRIYVRRSDEEGVQATRSVDFSLLPRQAIELRDRQIWLFNRTNIVSIESTRDGKMRKLSRLPNQAWSIGGKQIGDVESESLEELLNLFGNLQAVRWISRGTGELSELGFSPTRHRLSFEVRASPSGQAEKNTILTIDFGHITPRGRVRALVEVDGQPTMFEVPSNIIKALDADLSLGENAAK